MASWAVPTDQVEAVSVWDRHTRPDYGTTPANGADTVASPLQDPPLSRIIPGGGLTRGDDGSARPFNSRTFDLRAGQQLTTIEVVKRNGQYHMLLDGHSHDVGTGTSTRLWLPRFHEQQLRQPPRQAPKRVVAPCCIGLRLEDDEFAPLAARVVVTQRVWSNGVLLVDNVEVKRAELKPYSVNGLSTDVLTLPYPAIHTREPVVTIEDNDGVRRAEYQSAKQDKNALGNVTQATLDGTLGDAGSVTPQAVENGIAALAAAVSAALFAGTGPVGAAAAAGFAAYGAYGRVLLSGLQMFNPSDARVRARTTLPKTVHIPMEEFVAVVERLAESRATGTTGNGIGLTPNELKARGMTTDAVVLEWLLYGDANSESIDTTLGDTDVGGVKLNETLFEREQRVYAARGGQTPLVGRAASYINEKWYVTGNRLVSSGVDPREATKNRVEYTYTLEVEDADGQITRVAMDPLRSNGVDAGWIMNDYDGLRDRLRDARNRLINAIDINNPTDIDTRVDGLTMDAVYRTGQRVWATITRDAVWSQNRRWQDLRRRTRVVSEAQRRNDATIYGALVFDPEALARRLDNEILGREDARTDNWRNFELTRAIADNSGISPEVATGIDQADYDLYRQEHQVAYLQSVGLDDATPVGDFDWPMLRHCDLFMPILTGTSGEVVFTHPWRMLGWRVPAPRFDLPGPRSGSVRRLPQYAILDSKLTAPFGVTSVMSVTSVPSDSVDSRREAKGAVDSARKAWAIAGADWKEVHFTVEPTLDAVDSQGRTPPAFHWIELKMRDVTPPQRQAEVALSESVLSVGGGCVPHRIAADIYRAEYTPQSSEWQVAWATGDSPTGDAALLRALGLDTTLVALSAVAAFCETLVHTLLRAGSNSRLVDYMRAIVPRAQHVAKVTAAVVDLAYCQRSGSFSKTLLSRRDPFFACLVDTASVRACLHHMASWVLSQNAIEAAYLARPGVPFTDAEFRGLWTPIAQQESCAFSSAMKKLSKSLAVHPVRLTSIALQSMWIRDHKLVQELVVKTMPPSITAWTVLDVQMRAAGECYGRMLQMLTLLRAPGPMTRAEFSALLECLAWHPIVMQVNRRDQRPLQMLLHQWVPPAKEPSFHDRVPMTTKAVRDHMAALRTDRLLEVRDKAPNPTTAELATMLDEIHLVNQPRVRRRYHTPPSGLTESLPGDVIHTAEVEDLVVYGDALNHAYVGVWTEGLDDWQPPASAIVISHVGSVQNGKSRHSYLIDAQGRSVYLHFARMPDRPASLNSNVDTGGLPIELFALLERCEPVDPARVGAMATEANWVSGSLRERSRALMWNTERLLKASMLLFDSKQPGDVVAGAQMIQMAAINTPLEWSPDDRRCIAAAMVLAEAIRVSSFASGVVLRMQGPQVELTDVMQRFFLPLRAGGVGARLQAAPLREICIGLAMML